MTFGEATQFCREWWKSKFDKGQLSEKTYLGYIQSLKRPAKEWADRLIASFSRHELEIWHAELTQEISPAKANRTLFSIKQNFVWACREKYLKNDPAKGISYSNESCHERKRYMKPQEVEGLIEAAQKNTRCQYLYLVVALAVEHGANRQEILSLRWNDIDFEDARTVQFDFLEQKIKWKGFRI